MADEMKVPQTQDEAIKMGLMRLTDEEFAEIKRKYHHLFTPFNCTVHTVGHK